MTTPSIVKSPRRTRKTKSAALPKPIQPTPEMIRAHAVEQIRNEINHFLETATDAEMKIIGHLNVRDCGGMFGLMKEVRRLLGESIAKCKIIPFPVGGKRGVKVAKEA